MTPKRKICCNGGVARAFTIIELIVVIVIISIAALIAIPTLSSAGDSQVRSAANMIAADIEYAKNMAISRQQMYSVIFNTSSNSYKICDKVGNVIEHPINISSDFVVNISDESRLSQVEIISALFDSTDTLTFDYLGSPYNGLSNSLNDGKIILDAGGYSITINVQPVTGYLIFE